MIIKKNGLSSSQLGEVIKYSMRSDCQFLFELKPEGVDHVNKRELCHGSAVRLLKIEEYVHEEISASGKKNLSRRVKVTLMVEDDFYVELPENKKFFKSGKVPARIHNEIAEILNRNGSFA